MGVFLSFLFPPKPAIKYDFTLYTSEAFQVVWDTLTESKISFPSQDGKESVRNIIKWAPKDTPRGIVIISHGLYEHGLRYYKVAHAFTAKGFVVFAIDHYAHGKSDGERGFIDDHNILPRDFAHLAVLARTEYPGLSLSIVSHSMGTLVTILAMDKIPDVKCIIFSAPALFSGPGGASPFGFKFLYPISKSSIAPILARLLATLDPKGPGFPIFSDSLTHNTSILHRIDVDPWHTSKWIMNKTAHEFLAMSLKARDLVPTLKIPFLVMHGEKDELILPKGSPFLYNFAGTVEADKKLIMYPCLKHELFNETEKEASECIDEAVTYVIKYAL
jgi:acylglycerol lipase